MKTLRTYILKEAVVPFFLSFLVLSFVFLLGNLVKLADLVVNKGVHASTIGELMLWIVPVIWGYILPAACLVAVILTFGRLSADNEVLAIRAGGIPLHRLLLPLAVIGLLLSLFSLYLNDQVIPKAYHKRYQMIKNLSADNPLALLEEGVFIHAFDKLILFIHKIEDNKLMNITIYQPQKDGLTRTIIAREGEFTPVPNQDKIKVKLMNGTADEPDLENPNEFYKLNFENYFMTLDLAKQKENFNKKPKGMTLEELRVRRQEMLDMGAEEKDTSRLKTEFLRRITWSFTPLIFILFGFPIAVITHRREKSANIVLTVICAASYYIIFLGCEALSIKSIVPTQWIMWVPNLIGLTVALILNYQLNSIRK